MKSALKQALRIFVGIKKEKKEFVGKNIKNIFFNINY